MKSKLVALAVVATVGLGSVSAFAQDHDHDGRGRGEWQHQRVERGRSDWGRDHRYEAPGYYAPSYSYRNDDGDVAGALVLGALTGALVGQAANTYSPPPVAYYNPPPVTYYSPPPATYYNPGYNYYGY